MGWFESSEGSGIILGDDALDATHRFIKEIAELYEEGCERKPTLNEFVALLESGLKYSGSECIGDLETRAVTQVAIKTEKKKRDQKFRVGDIFAIPLEKNLFVFGRYMYDTSGGTLVEIFRAHARSASFSSRIAESGRLFGPIISSVDRALKGWRWLVVTSDESYRIPDADLETEFSSPAPSGHGWAAARFRSNDWRYISEEEAKQMEDNRLWGPEAIEERIRKELGLLPRKSP